MARLTRPLNPGLKGPFFFDANAITLPTSLTSPAFEYVAGWCARFAVPVLIPRVALEEMLYRAEMNLRELAGKLSPLKPFIKSLSSIATKTMSEELRLAAIDLLAKHSVRPVDTPKLDQAELLRMAINHIPPFDPRGDKGFKDTVILETILEHCRANSFKHAYVVSGDGAFSYAEVAKRFLDAGVTLTVLKNLADARDFLQSRFGEAFTEEVTERSNRLDDFITGHKDQLLALVNAMRQNTDFLDDLRTKASLFGRLTQIHSIEFVKVDTAYTKALFQDLPDGHYRVSCGAFLYIRAHFVAFEGRPSVFRVDDKGLTPQVFPPNEEDVEIERSIGFAGTIGVRDHTNFEDLRIESVLLDDPGAHSSKLRTKDPPTG